MPLYIAIVAGEASGDILGAGLIRSLRLQHPDIIVEGIGGPAMQEAGCRSLFPMETLSVMGLIEPLKHLPQILKIRKGLKQHFLKHRPDVFIGIDAPDFNLGLEKILKKNGIKTVHYVSPSIWAWRAKRIFKIKKAVDLMLCLLPFEPAIYLQQHVHAEFVGHPLADDIPMHSDRLAAREQLGLPPDANVLTLMPGSRANEMNYLAEIFIKTARCCVDQISNLRIVVPMVNEARYHQFEEILQRCAFTDIAFKNLVTVTYQSRLAITAADVVLQASGTATLEAMLLKRPMVVAYRMHPFTYWLAKRLVKLKYFSFPNLLTQEPLVPELLQHDANVQNLTMQVLKQFKRDHTALMQRFTNLHHSLQRDASQRAAEEILRLCY